MNDPSWHIPDPDTQPEFYADVPTKRLIAWVVDTLAVIVICLLILPFTAFTGIFFFPFLMLVVGFAYRVITIARSSATWGMQLTAIEFRTLSGQRFDLQMAFLHTLGFTVSCGFFPLQIASIVLMLTTKRSQGLSDHVLGTVAVNRRAAL
ncbi:RDD family protein [Roseovarius litorisediminis]|uniref:RDD family protein n=1 Tax=Roseovarius litorisediminis TaxID=1312363 RepID=A0A1Y5TQV9_9RHOB|nr:RDD family protein [Roseovarius litorisediminis]SLN69937.1 RDD family protein [Roseovarius litorisediminis]